MLSSKSDGGTIDRSPRDAVDATSPAPQMTSLRKLARDAARDMESRIILHALQQHHWNRRRTAEALNISYRSLMYKMKYCNLRNPALPSPPEGQ
jgi:transcriptional regulator with PAS, ATPase and Fis domain